MIQKHFNTKWANKTIARYMAQEMATGIAEENTYGVSVCGVKKGHPNTAVSIDLPHINHGIQKLAIRDVHSMYILAAAAGIA